MRDVFTAHLKTLAEDVVKMEERDMISRYTTKTVLEEKID